MTFFGNDVGSVPSRLNYPQCLPVNIGRVKKTQIAVPNALVLETARDAKLSSRISSTFPLDAVAMCTALQQIAALQKELARQSVAMVDSQDRERYRMESVARFYSTERGFAEKMTVKFPVTCNAGRERHTIIDGVVAQLLNDLARDPSITYRVIGLCIAPHPPCEIAKATPTVQASCNLLSVGICSTLFHPFFISVTRDASPFHTLVVSAFRRETEDLTKETRRLAKGVRDLAELSPRLRQEVGELSRRVDAGRLDRKV